MGQEHSLIMEEYKREQDLNHDDTSRKRSYTDDLDVFRRKKLKLQQSGALSSTASEPPSRKKSATLTLPSMAGSHLTPFDRPPSHDKLKDLLRPDSSAVTTAGNILRTQLTTKSKSSVDYSRYDRGLPTSGKESVSSKSRQRNSSFRQRSRTMPTLSQRPTLNRDAWIKQLAAAGVCETETESLASNEIMDTDDDKISVQLVPVTKLVNDYSDDSNINNTTSRNENNTDEHSITLVTPTKMNYWHNATSKCVIQNDPPNDAELTVDEPDPDPIQPMPSLNNSTWPMTVQQPSTYSAFSRQNEHASSPRIYRKIKIKQETNPIPNQENNDKHPNDTIPIPTNVCHSIHKDNEEECQSKLDTSILLQILNEKKLQQDIHKEGNSDNVTKEHNDDNRPDTPTWLEFYLGSDAKLDSLSREKAKRNPVKKKMSIGARQKKHTCRPIIDNTFLTTPSTFSDETSQPLDLSCKNVSPSLNESLRGKDSMTSNSSTKLMPASENTAKPTSPVISASLMYQILTRKTDDVRENPHRTSPMSIFTYSQTRPTAGESDIEELRNVTLYDKLCDNSNRTSQYPNCRLKHVPFVRPIPDLLDYSQEEIALDQEIQTVG